MSIPNLDNVIYYGQRGGSVYPTGTYGTTANLAPRPADSISISLEFLRGVDAAHEWAEDNYSIGTIADAVISAEVTRLREEAAK